ncbi:MAG: molybdenum ABC transporter ATP-binding protein [Hyphomicrobiales bacterium]|nr:molybdenum ABC transporter ATP-binding protein [Hyphomicrobiales bacterium]
MTLTVEVRHQFGAFHLDASFVSSGRLTALFGSSGSGKTSIVNLIGGLVRPREGRIAIDGRVLVDTKADIFIPKHQRRIGYVFQDARLFPHLSIRQNLQYGRWFTAVAERVTDFDGIVGLLGLESLLDRKPNLLSGGEKQRVAIGRALLASPKLLLMDEPLASLDDARKAEILPYIERLRDEAKTPIVYVSHAISEVARLATDIVVMSNGRVLASGAARDIMQRLDLIPAGERGETGAVIDMVMASYDDAFDISVLRSAAGDIRTPGKASAIGERLRVRIRARDVMIAMEKPRGLSALNVLEGTVVQIGETSGPLVEIRLMCGGEAVISRITRQSLHVLQLHTGMTVFAVVKTVSFDAGNVSPGVNAGLLE